MDKIDGSLVLTKKVELYCKINWFGKRHQKIIGTNMGELQLICDTKVLAIISFSK